MVALFRFCWLLVARHRRPPRYPPVVVHDGRGANRGGWIDGGFSGKSGLSGFSDKTSGDGGFGKGGESGLRGLSDETFDSSGRSRGLGNEGIGGDRAKMGGLGGDGGGGVDIGARSARENVCRLDQGGRRCL